VKTSPDCPEVECWQALLNDSIADAEQRQRLERHLEMCPTCQQRFERGAGRGHPLLQLARALGDPTVAPADPTLVQVMQRLHEAPSPLHAGAEQPVDLYFLSPSERPDLLGTLGDYEVQEVIGQGGMGVVLKAFEPALHRHVAIKVLSPLLAGSATARLRFTREAKAAAAVSHDHVVVVHGVHDSGLPYLVMEYVAGESLQERLDRLGPLEPVEIVRIGLQTACGLAAAHKQGLIHRDIKPANLLLEKGLARVTITDFGLARAGDDIGLTQHGVVTGTPEHMAPEQARGEIVDPRADLFSLGCVLYAMATGVPPFRAATTVAVLRQVCDETPRPVRELNPDIPAWLEAFIARLLEKPPADRFQSAVEVAQLLEGYLAHLRQPRTVAAPPLSPIPADDHRGVFGRLLGGAVVLVGTVAVILLALSLLRAQVAPPQPKADRPVGDQPVVPIEKNDVWSAAISKDGKFMAAGWGYWDQPGEVGVWELTSREPLQRFAEERGVGSVALSADGKLLATGSWTGHVRVYDWAIGKELYDFPVEHIARVAFSPDGQLLVTAAEDPNTVQLWDMRDGKLVADLPHPQEPKFRLHCVTFSPMGDRVVAGGGQWEAGGVAQATIWDLAGRKQVGKLTGHQRPILALCYSPDGKTIATGSVDATVRLWDAGSGECVKTLTGHKHWVECVAFSADGKTLVSGGHDGTVRFWNVAEGEEMRQLAFPGGARTLCFTPRGNLLVGGGLKTLKDFSPDRLQELGTYLDGTAPEALPMERVPVTTPSVPVQADASEPRPRSWLAAAGLVGVAVAFLASLVLTLTLTWQRLRAGWAPAATVAPGPLSFACSECGKKLKLKAAGHAGKMLKCPHCGKLTATPSGPMAPTEQPRPRGLWAWRYVLAWLTVSGLLGVLLAIGLWPTPSSSSPIVEEPYVSRLQLLANRVKAEKSTTIDIRSFRGVTDRDLSVLAGLTNLKELNLDNSDITDAGLKEVAGATNLISLSLTGTQVTNTGLAELKTLSRLEFLRLDRLPITDAGMAHLSAFPRLKNVSLYKTAVADDGLAVCKQLPLLEEISLDDTQVGDVGLRHLHTCKSLKKVRVWNTRVTDKGMAELRKAVPGVQVRK
jgi:eukaryotic-like serine/threonine-protein kinase